MRQGLYISELQGGVFALTFCPALEPRDSLERN